MAASSSQETENMADSAVFSVQDSHIPDENKENDVSPFQDKIPICNNKITDALWEKFYKITAVQAILEFEEKAKVEKAILKVIKKNKGYFPENITATDIYNEIEEVSESEDDSTASQDKPISPTCILDKVHNDDGTQHELQVAYQCDDCDREGVKPVLKLV